MPQGRSAAAGAPPCPLKSPWAPRRASTGWVLVPGPRRELRAAPGRSEGRDPARHLDRCDHPSTDKPYRQRFGGRLGVAADNYELVFFESRDCYLGRRLAARCQPPRPIDSAGTRDRRRRNERQRRSSYRAPHPRASARPVRRCPSNRASPGLMTRWCHPERQSRVGNADCIARVWHFGNKRLGATSEEIRCTCQLRSEAFLPLSRQETTRPTGRDRVQRRALYVRFTTDLGALISPITARDRRHRRRPR